MNEFLMVLMNVRSLRAALHELSVEQVKEAHEKIELIYLDRLEQAEKEQTAQLSTNKSWPSSKRCWLKLVLTPLSWLAAPRQQRLRLKLNERLVPRNTVTLKMA